MMKNLQKASGTAARYTARRGVPRGGAKLALTLAILALSGFGASAEEGNEATGPSGFFFAVPVYLYERYSASGVQLGWQRGNWQLRIEAGLIDEAKEGSDTLIAYPSLGIFYSHEWDLGIRTYEGVTVGVETGIAKAFAGQVLTLNVLTGAEWFVSRRKSLYIELGSGIGIFRKEGAFNGGTVIGGGMRCYL
jgi:hypothetical protein